MLPATLGVHIHLDLLTACFPADGHIALTSRPHHVTCPSMPSGTLSHVQAAHGQAQLCAYWEGKWPVATPQHSLSVSLPPRAASTSYHSDAGAGHRGESWRRPAGCRALASLSTDGETQARGKQHSAQGYPAGSGWVNLLPHQWAILLPTASAVLGQRGGVVS